jgi:predicted O-methyltransferase YrrM
MNKKIDLNTERMYGLGPYLRESFQVNYLYGLNDLCEQFVKDNFEILELGSNDGVSTSLFSYFAKKVTCVDIKETEKMKILKESSENIFFHQMSFDEFLKQDGNKQYDLIYIDGNHGYEDVYSDIKNFKNKVKKGGFISGHDYIKETSGVERAVREHFSDKEIIIFSDSSWIINL